MYVCMLQQGEGLAEVRTQPNNSVKENIASVYGQPVSRELLQVSCDDKKLGYKMNGYVSNANYSMKKLMLILFINRKYIHTHVHIRMHIRTYYMY